MPHKILLVDDETANIRLLERLFRDEYLCLTASSGNEALELLDQHDVAVIISDQRMPQMSGLELLKRSSDRRPHMVRILLTGYTDLEALVEAVNCGLVYMYVSKPWHNDDLTLRVSRAVETYENNKTQHLLAASNERLNARLKDMRCGFVKAVTRILQLEDPYLFLHAGRVNKYAEFLGQRLGLGEELLWDMMAASFLHDLGIVGTRGMIYPGFGQEENVCVLNDYAARAAEIVSCVSELKNAADMVRYHYENFDGSGRPLGLIEDQIPLAVRILRVAKSYDLLTSPPHNEQELDHPDAIERLRRHSGKEFDPQVIETLADLTTDSAGLVPAELREPQFCPPLPPV